MPTFGRVARGLVSIVLLVSNTLTTADGFITKITKVTKTTKSFLGFMVFVAFVAFVAFVVLPWRVTAI
jgi:hypothetical protein